jgi:hypothetical protein
MIPDGCDAAEHGDLHRRASRQVDLVERSYSKRNATRNSAAPAAARCGIPSNRAVCDTRAATLAVPERAASAQEHQRCHVIDIVHLIQTAIAPVFLLTGVASTLGVLTTRLSRIVDRARVLEDRIAGHPGEGPQLHGELAVLARRAHFINIAISLATISATLVALVVVTLFANAFFASELSVLIALLFVGAMVCLSAAYIVFFFEGRIAVAALRIGISRS